jgi:arylsulfatase A-like enzyme
MGASASALAGSAVRGCVIAGFLSGAADALLTAASNPDPGLAAYRAGLVTGPVLLGMSGGLAVGVAVELAARAMRRPPTAHLAPALVAALWGVSLVVEARRSATTPAALMVLGALIAVACICIATTAAAGAVQMQRLTRRTQRGMAGAVAALAALAMLASLPAAVDTVGGGGGPCATAAPNGRPNLLLITIDTLRADAGAAMASYRRLAARGVAFTQHVTPAPWTLPSIASMLTGLSPERHGAGRPLAWNSTLAKSPLPDTVRTLAGALRDEGYVTQAIVTNPFLTPRYGIDRGFCGFENLTMRGEIARGLEHTTAARLLRPWTAPFAAPDRARAVRERAEGWMDAHVDAPFFLWLHFLDPHAPYGDRDDAPTSLTLDLMAFQAGRSLDAPFRSIALLRAGELRPGPSERARLVELYRQDVAYLDAQLARLLDHLDATGLRERTSIVLTSDHGEEFWEHGGTEHGHSLYEEVINVPLVIAPANLAPAARVETGLTSSEDLPATIATLAGLPLGTMPGRDMLAATAQDHAAIALGNLLFGPEWTGVRTTSSKYIRSELGEERLYDLVRDPAERRDTLADPGVDAPAHRETWRRAVESARAGG